MSSILHRWRSLGAGSIVLVLTGLGGCSTGGECGSGGACAAGSCTPNASACTDDNTAVTLCGANGSSVTQRTCPQPTVCGPAAGGGFDCILPGHEGGTSSDRDAASSEDGAAADDAKDGGDGGDEEAASVVDAAAASPADGGDAGP